MLVFAGESFTSFLDCLRNVSLRWEKREKRSVSSVDLHESAALKAAQACFLL